MPKSMEEIYQMAVEGVASADGDPEELTRWRIAYLMGITAGFLIRPDLEGEKWNLENPLHRTIVTIRETAQDQLRAYATNNPSMQSLEHLKYGTSLLRAAYETNAQELLELEPECNMVKDMDRWVHTRPEIDERFARETLEIAGMYE